MGSTEMMTRKKDVNDLRVLEEDGSSVGSGYDGGMNDSGAE